MGKQGGKSTEAIFRETERSRKQLAKREARLERKRAKASRVLGITLETDPNRSEIKGRSNND